MCSSCSLRQRPSPPTIVKGHVPYMERGLLFTAIWAECLVDRISALFPEILGNEVRRAGRSARTSETGGDHRMNKTIGAMWRHFCFLALFHASSLIIASEVYVPGEKARDAAGNVMPVAGARKRKLSVCVVSYREVSVARENLSAVVCTFFLVCAWTLAPSSPAPFRK